MKLKFIIDLDYEKVMLLHFLRNDQPRMKPLIDDWLARGILPNIKVIKTSRLEKILDELIAGDFLILKKYLVSTQKSYQSHWDEINNTFFCTTEKITGFSWKHPKYECVVSLYHVGISNWGGPKIARIWKENPFTMRKITAHELLISHFFTIFNSHYIYFKISDREKWSLAEIFSWCLTGLEADMIKLWPWIMVHEKYPLNHNYPQLINWQKKIKNIYLKKQDFESFIEDSIRIIRKYPY